ncbi:MAG: BrnT family toxin [Pyrinomonadaceae bacterium]
MASILENEGFEWDDGNAGKNWHGHRVIDAECEQVFSNKPLMTVVDKSHSQSEQRFQALGQADSGRRLFVAFTVRRSLIRVISAREMNTREERRYEEEIKRNS